MSQFFVSFEDDLLRRYGSERMEGVVSKLGDVAVENKMLTKQVGSAQKRVEGVNFDVRKQLLDYDDVLRQQREIMYEQRDFILDNDDVHGVVHEMFERVVSNVVASYRSFEGKNASFDFAGLKEALMTLNLVDAQFDASQFEGKDEGELVAFITEKGWNEYETKIADVKEQFAQVENDVVLQSIDRAWVDHIDSMAKLREGIHLRSYAQDKPLQAYVQEGFEMFEDMLSLVAQNIVVFCMNVKIEHRQG